MSRRAALLALAAAVALSACTGIPSSSVPQTVQPLGSAATSPADGPPRDAPPRLLVDGFLDANAVDPGNHELARQYLTAAARGRWSDATATVITDESVGTYDAQRRVVPVYGRVLGTLDADGVWRPQLTGSGSGGAKVPFNFTIKTAGGRSRIDALQNGLLLTDLQFRSYSQHTLYFWDKANHYLVPDLRYSALDDVDSLASWLVRQLVTGPRTDLQGSAVNTDTLPAPTQARRVTTRLGAVVTVQVPGSSQLAASGRDRLAAQLSQTLQGNRLGGPVRVLDGNRAVTIPLVRSTVFSAADFPKVLGPPAPAREVYYLLNGRIRQQDGKSIPGPLGTGLSSVISIALARPPSVGSLAVAAVQHDPAGGRLLVGTQYGGMHVTAVRGKLSRPAWAPGLGEVWIGDGPKLYCVTTDGRTARTTQIPLPSAVGQIVALRFSPDGSRLAMVASAGDGATQLIVFPVVRGAAVPQLPDQATINPEGAVLTDVAWFSSMHLVASGYLADGSEPRIFDTSVDGSGWADRGIGNLSAPPSSLTAAPDALVWVSTQDGYLWQQNASSWVSPLNAAQTPGTAPVYLG